MESRNVIAAFSALGQTTRLALFRSLVQAGPEGLAAGILADRLGVLQNTLSAHLAILQSAGLIVPHRQGRSVIYSADMDGLRRLLGWLLQDCCGGRAELCAPLIDQITCTC